MTSFYITEGAWNTILGYAKIAYDEDKNEISGLCIARKSKEGHFLLAEPDILEQENTGVTTSLDPDACVEYYMKMANKYPNEELRYVWWHSHHNMGVKWSGTDENEMEQWKNDSFSMALVVNLKEEYTFRVSQWAPIETYEDVPLHVLRKNGWTQTSEMKKKYKKLCSNKVETVTKWNGYNQMSLGVNNGYISADKKEIKEYNKSFNISSSIVNTEIDLYGTLCEIIDEIGDLNLQYSEGNIDLHVYHTHITALNKSLKSRDIGFTVRKFMKHEKLVTAIGTKHTHEFIKYKDEKTKSRYVQLGYEAHDFSYYTL